MKKTLFVITLSLFISFCLFASEEELTPAQSKIYNEKALYVSERVETRGSSIANAYSLSRNSAIAFGSSTSSTSLTWDAYQGGHQISKADFFGIAGYDDYQKLCLDLEAKNKKRKNLGIGLTVGGGVAYVAGIIIMCTDLDHPTLTNQFYVGLGIGLAACLPLGFGIDYLLTPEEEPNIAASFAFGVADSYNKELQARIKGSSGFLLFKRILRNS